MNFEFKILVHGFIKAGELERELKKMGISYDVSLAKSVANKKSRVFVTPMILGTVLRYLDEHPTCSDQAAASATGVGHNTVNRIRNGKHSLQQKGNVVSHKIVKQEVSK